MGWYYSFGIVFNNYIAAELCCNDLKNSEIVLSNNNCIQLAPDVLRHEENGFLEKELYISRMFIDGLGTSETNLKLYEKPYFNEIRQFFYNYLKNLKFEFEFAHYELEAADMLSINEPSEQIVFSIENQQMSFEKNSDNLPKRYIDGMVISSNNLNKLEKYKDQFQSFKPNYYWLPLKEFKLSK